MPVMDEFREEREAIKNAGWQYKLKYFWDYYKWFVIGGIFALFIIISIVKDVINTKDFIFNGVMLNTFGDDMVMQEFADKITNIWIIYAICVLISFTISLGSVLWQTLRAARTNPAGALKKE